MDNDKISLSMSYTSVDGILNSDFVIVSYKKIYLQSIKYISAKKEHIPFCFKQEAARSSNISEQNSFHNTLMEQKTTLSEHKD